jgi:Uma2 family endonuclease
MRVLAEERDLGTVLTAPCAMRVPQRPSGREPDVMFIAKENAHRIAEKFVDGPADVVVEIISDDSVTRDRRDKFYEYALAGIREYWMANYRQKRAEFYRLNEYGTYDLIALEEGGVFRSEAFPGFWFKVEWLWQEPLPKLLTVLREWGLV